MTYALRITRSAGCKACKLRGSFPSARIVVRAESGEENRFVIGQVARRTLLVSFKCNVCGGRTDRMVNPRVWNKGTVFLQCKSCEKWHLMKDNLNLIDEIRYRDEED